VLCGALLPQRPAFRAPHAQLLLAVTLGSLFGQNRFALSGGCGVNFTLRLFCCFTLRFLFCQALNLFFAGNALAFGFCFFLGLLTVESVIHQQGHFVVRLNRAASCRSNSSFMASASACSAFMASSALMRSCSASHSVSGDVSHRAARHMRQRTA
jgi:hypothetical protein